jgi:hypothetical protein
MDKVGLHPSIDGLIKRVKRANFYVSVVNRNFRSPLVSVLGPINAVEPGRVLGRHFRVLHVHAFGDRSQVHNPVVMPNPVDVINVNFRPLSMLKRPEDSMRLMTLAKYISAKISIPLVEAIKRGRSCKPSVEGRGQAARRKLAFLSEHVGASRKPSHLSRWRVMCDNLPQEANVGCNHFSLTLLSKL